MVPRQQSPEEIAADLTRVPFALLHQATERLPWSRTAGMGNLRATPGATGRPNSQPGARATAGGLTTSSSSIPVV
jgi:hypothetical protein